MNQQDFPAGFLAAGWNVGIKDDTLDFGVLHSTLPATGAAVFTRNNFPGQPIIVGREHVSRGRIRTIVVNSKNANVATGENGLRMARNMCEWTARSLGTESVEVLPSSTGVIGRPLPEEKIRLACESIKDKLKEPDFDSFSRAIMTTDTRPKLRCIVLKSGIRITGVCKGAGMIEPSMATMLAYVATDAGIDSGDLQRLLRATADRTFNRISIDSDTSTSDTFAAIANGASGVQVDFSDQAFEALESMADPFEQDALASLPFVREASREFVDGLLRLCRDLARDIVMDGEGATKLIELRVEKARDRSQALRIGRSVINSPLVKTAIYGADPNWGRLVMAVGKSFEDNISIEDLEIFFGDLSLKGADETMLKKLSGYLKNSTIQITIRLGTGGAAETLWGCDLTEEYVRINAYYTT